MVRRRKVYRGLDLKVENALQLAYDLKAKIRERTKKDLKRNVTTRIVGKKELEGYMLQCDQTLPRQMRSPVWYEAAMRRMIDTIVVLQTENEALRRVCNVIERTEVED